MKIERLLLVFICLLIVGMICWPFLLNRASWDFHVHDTYYVVTTQPVIVYGFVYCCFLFGLYTVVRKKSGRLNLAIGLFHIIATTAFIGFFLSLAFFVYDSNRAGFPRRYMDFSKLNLYHRFLYLPFYERWLFVLLLLFLAAQLIFFVYFFVQLFSKRKMPAF